MWQEHSESAWEQRIALYKSDQHTCLNRTETPASQISRAEC